MTTNLEKLQDVKDKLATVYRDEVLDLIFDNSLLDELNTAIKNVELAIKNLQERGP